MIPWYRSRTGPPSSCHRSSIVSCCSKNFPALNWATPSRSAGGAGRSQPSRDRAGGRLGGVFRRQQAAETELVLDELADARVRGLGHELVELVGVGDEDTLTDVVSR